MESGIALGPPGNLPAGGLVLGGKFHLKVLAVTPSTVAAGILLTQVTALRDGRPEPVIAQMAERTPCLLRLRPDGKILETRFAPDVPEEDREVLRLACGWEFCMRAEPAWSTEERGAGQEGGFRADYQSRSDGTIFKSRAFVPMAGAASGQRVLSSAFIGRPGNLWLDSLEGSESTELLVNGKPMAWSSVSVRFQRQDPQGDPPSAPVWSFPLSAETLDKEFTATPGTAVRESVNAHLELRILTARYGSMPVAEIIGLAAGAGDFSMQEKLPVLDAARDWLRVHGAEGAAKIQEALRAGTSQDTSGLLVHALGSAGHQEALAGLLESPELLSPAALLQTVVEAGATKSPEGRLIEALSRLTDLEVVAGQEEDLRINDATWYSLGSLAENSPALRQKLEHTLGRALPETASVMREVALRTLANARAADPVILEFAAGTASDENRESSLRAASLEVLTRTPVLPGEGAAAATAALSASSVEVQLAALNVFQNHPESLSSDTRSRIASLANSQIESLAAAARQLATR